MHSPNSFNENPYLSFPILNVFLMGLVNSRCNLRSVLPKDGFIEHLSHNIKTMFLNMKMFFVAQTSRPNVFKFIMNSNILHKKGHMC